jgi:large subunit ribosomal protein L32
MSSKSKIHIIITDYPFTLRSYAMPVPKRKHSRMRRDKRSANKGIAVKSITSCLTCQAPVSPHSLCANCGYYKGVKIIRTKTDRMHERGQARQEQRARMEERAGPQEPVEKPE